MNEREACVFVNYFQMNWSISRLSHALVLSASYLFHFTGPKSGSRTSSVISSTPFLDHDRDMSGDANYAFTCTQRLS
jgi:hypothetical protein